MNIQKSVNFITNDKKWNFNILKDIWPTNTIKNIEVVPVPVSDINDRLA